MHFHVTQGGCERREIVLVATCILTSPVEQFPQWPGFIGQLLW